MLLGDRNGLGDICLPEGCIQHEIHSQRSCGDPAMSLL